MPEVEIILENDWGISYRSDPKDPEKEVCDIALCVSCAGKRDVITAKGNDVEEAIKNVFNKAIQEVAMLNLNGNMPTPRIGQINTTRRGAGHARVYKADCVGPKSRADKEWMSFSSSHLSPTKALMLSLAKALAVQGVKLSLPFRE